MNFKIEALVENDDTSSQVEIEGIFGIKRRRFHFSN